MALIHKQKALHTYCERPINQSVYRKNKRFEEYFHPYKFTPFIFSFYFFHIFILEQTYSFWFHRDISFSPFLLPSLAFQSFCFFIIFLIIILCEHSKFLFFGHRILFILPHKFFCFWEAEFLFFLWNFYFHKMTFDGLKLSTTFETWKYCLHNSVNKPENEEVGRKWGPIELIRVFAKKNWQVGKIMRDWRVSLLSSTLI